MALLKKGSNTKLGKSIASFNLPAITTCPGRTRLCEGMCYADKGFYNMPNVKRSNEAGEAAARSSVFVEEITKELVASKTIRAVRIHASGDFYSPEYLGDWITIAANNPEVKFWAYTRCWRLDEFKMPLAVFGQMPNVQLFASLDDEIKDLGEEPPQWMRTADLVQHWDNTPKDTVECPNQKNNTITCEKCTYCFKPEGQRKKHVVFAAH